MLKALIKSPPEYKDIANEVRGLNGRILFNISYFYFPIMPYGISLLYLIVQNTLA